MVEHGAGRVTETDFDREYKFNVMCFPGLPYIIKV